MESNLNPSGESQPVSDIKETSDKVAYETYRKVLSEKKNRDAQLSDLKGELDSIKQKELESQGKQTEVIEALRKQLTDTREELTTTKNSYAWTSISSNVKAAAKDAGCIDTKAFMKLVDKQDISALEIYDDYSVNKDSVNDLIDRVKKEYATVGLFNTKRGGISDVNPSNKIEKKKTKPLSELSREELMNLARDIKN